MLTLSTGVNLTGVNLNCSQINVDNWFANLLLKLTIYLMKGIPEPDQRTGSEQFSISEPDPSTWSLARLKAPPFATFLKILACLKIILFLWN
jgi:hypothetical protein